MNPKYSNPDSGLTYRKFITRPNEGNPKGIVISRFAYTFLRNVLKDRLDRDSTSGRKDKRWVDIIDIISLYLQYSLNDKRNKEFFDELIKKRHDIARKPIEETLKECEEIAKKIYNIEEIEKKKEIKEAKKEERKEESIPIYLPTKEELKAEEESMKNKTIIKYWKTSTYIGIQKFIKMKPEAYKMEGIDKLCEMCLNKTLPPEIMIEVQKIFDVIDEELIQRIVKDFKLGTSENSPKTLIVIRRDIECFIKSLIEKYNLKSIKIAYFEDVGTIPTDYDVAVVYGDYTTKDEITELTQSSEYGYKVRDDIDEYMKKHLYEEKLKNTIIPVFEKMRSYKSIWWIGKFNPEYFSILEEHNFIIITISKDSKDIQHLPP